MRGDGGNCEAVATVAVVFAYNGGGGDSVCFICPGTGAIVMLSRQWPWFSLQILDFPLSSLLTYPYRLGYA